MALAVTAIAPALPAQAAAKPTSTPTVTTGPVDKDLNGDGVPDLVAVGGPGTGLDSGVWSALGVKSHKTGVGTGQVQTPATNVGLRGSSALRDDATAFDGTQVVTGRFYGTDRQDLLWYVPTVGDSGIVRGAGDGTMLDAWRDANTSPIGYDYLVDTNGNVPLQLASAFEADGVDISGAGIPDLFGVSGDAANGYRLGYHPNVGAPALYFGVTTLTNPTPTGGTDWQNWSLASTETANGVALFLRNAGTGDLYLWTGITMLDIGDGTGTLAHTQYQVAANWNTGVTIGTLEAADINTDGTPDLWAVFTDGTYRAYLTSGLSTDSVATVTATRARPLV